MNAEWFQLQEGELTNQTPPTAASHMSCPCFALEGRPPTIYPNFQLPNWLAKEYVLSIEMKL